ncbi:hypothetical protein Tco_0083048 [Tanacetum coccineum]
MEVVLVCGWWRLRGWGSEGEDGRGEDGDDDDGGVGGCGRGDDDGEDEVAAGEVVMEMWCGSDWRRLVATRWREGGGDVMSWI